MTGKLKFTVTELYNRQTVAAEIDVRGITMTLSEADIAAMGAKFHKDQIELESESPRAKRKPRKSDARSFSTLQKADQARAPSPRVGAPNGVKPDTSGEGSTRRGSLNYEADEFVPSWRLRCDMPEVSDPRQFTSYHGACI